MLQVANKEGIEEETVRYIRQNTRRKEDEKRG